MSKIIIYTKHTKQKKEVKKSKLALPNIKKLGYKFVKSDRQTSGKLLFMGLIILCLFVLVYPMIYGKVNTVEHNNKLRLSSLVAYADYCEKKATEVAKPEDKPIIAAPAPEIKKVSTLTDRENQVVKVCRSIGISDNRQIASILGQIKIETNDFNLVEEAYYLANPAPYRARYGGYHGRGLIQLTWKSNYQAWSNWLGVDLISNPAILLSDFDLNAKIACSGIKHGSFTGRGNGNLDTYINDNKTDYYNSRQLVNGDKNYRRSGKLIGNLLVEYSQNYYNQIK